MFAEVNYVIVSDYDRTITDENLKLYEPVLDALKILVEDHNFHFMIASGRTLDYLTKHLEGVNFVDAFIAENGAVVYLPRSESTCKFGQNNEELRVLLRESSIPFDAGEIVISLRRDYAGEIDDFVSRLDMNVRVEYNRDSIMVLPAGVTKATGVKEALNNLGLDDARLICIGDGENDQPLFDIASLSVATADSVSELKKRADIICSETSARGVTKFLNELRARMLADGHLSPM